MAKDAPVGQALERGNRLAEQVLAFRTRELRRRNAAVSKRVKTRTALAPVAPPTKSVRAVGPQASAGTLIAEGDSWFDYPWTDILRLLEDRFGYDVESVAHHGDRVEEMAYGGGQLEELTRRIEKVIRRNAVPQAILLSGGGNDVAGAEFGMLVDHALSPTPGLNEQVVTGIIDQRIRLAYATILAAVTRICDHLLGRPVLIVIHGYDYPVPDGRGFLGGWWFLPGPWLEPGFREKGFGDLPRRVELARALIDRLNEMLTSLSRSLGFEHLRYVDLRNTLSTSSNYKRLWANELHPTPRGFELVTSKIEAAFTGM